MKKNGLFHPLVTASLLAAGFLIVWLVVGTWTVEVWEYAREDRRPHEQLRFTADGTPILQRYLGSFSEHTDLTGQPIGPPERFCNPAPIPAKGTNGDRNENSWSLRVRGFADGRPTRGHWYFLRDGAGAGLGYFVGYDVHSKQRIGYLGASGFREDEPPGDDAISLRSPQSGILSMQGTTVPAMHWDTTGGLGLLSGSVSPSDLFLFGRGGKVYHVDLTARTVRMILEDPRVRSGAIIMDPCDLKRIAPHRLVVRLDDEMLVFGEGQLVRTRYPIPEALRQKHVRFAETSKGEAVMECIRPGELGAETVERGLWWVSPAGTVRQSHASIRADENFPFKAMGGLVPAPVVLVIGTAVTRPAQLLEQEQVSSETEAFARAFTEFAPAMVIAQVIACFFALLCWLRQRRYGESRLECVIWPTFVLFFGLPGWIGYRFGRTWPALEPEPDAAPALLGTEVFA